MLANNACISFRIHILDAANVEINNEKIWKAIKSVIFATKYNTLNQWYYSRKIIYRKPNRRGRIEVICGSMFSGKTEELIRGLKPAKFAHQRVEIFKPSIDIRYSEDDVVSHDSHSIPLLLLIHQPVYYYSHQKSM